MDDYPDFSDNEDEQIPPSVFKQVNDDNDDEDPYATIPISGNNDEEDEGEDEEEDEEEYEEDEDAEDDDDDEFLVDMASKNVSSLLMQPKSSGQSTPTVDSSGYENVMKMLQQLSAQMKLLIDSVNNLSNNRLDVNIIESLTQTLSAFTTNQVYTPKHENVDGEELVNKAFKDF